MKRTHSTHEAPRKTTDLPAALANINSNVLDDAILKKLVDPDVYHEFARCRATGVAMDGYSADELAKSIREWAQSKGCIGHSDSTSSPFSKKTAATEIFLPEGLLRSSHVFTRALIIPSSCSGRST